MRPLIIEANFPDTNHRENLHARIFLNRWVEMRVEKLRALDGIIGNAERGPPRRRPAFGPDALGHSVTTSTKMINRCAWF